MRSELFFTWLGMSIGVWISEWQFTGQHYDRAMAATFWIGLTCALVAFKLRNRTLLPSER